MVNPVADFIAMPTSGAVGLEVQFVDTSTGSITSREWDFNNDSIIDSTLQNPAYTYNINGIHTVSLTVTGPGGSDTQTKVDYVTITPKADFTAAPTSGNMPLNVQFTDTSSSIITSWEWDFDNDSIIDSTIQNPSFIYATNGLYTVSLTVTGPGGSNTETKTDYITVIIPPPVADFTAVPLNGDAPLDVQFTDASTGNITTWEWDFDNDSIVDSFVQNPPPFTYNNPGRYTASLTVTGPGGSNTMTKVDYITVTPIADFTALPLNGLAPLNVQFTDTSIGTITTWEWDFDNDSIVDSAMQNPTYPYNNPGTYTVSLKVTGPAGSHTTTKVDYIIANTPNMWEMMSASPIAGRSMGTAVWTGTEMIVWGGWNGSNLNTGARYNPTTDSWALTTMTNAPSARRMHTVVWTNTEMIIWGGYDGSDLVSGARYNPSTDSWTLTTLTNAPSARRLHTAVWTGTEMIIWGGWASGNTNTGARYNPATDTWTPTTTTNAPSARYSQKAVWTGTEMIVWGGWDGSYANTGAKYNPATDTWTSITLSGAPSGRNYHSAVWTGTEMIIWGGYDGGHQNTGGRYNPSTDSWTTTTTTNAPSARRTHTAVWTGTEMIVWAGGEAGYLNTGGKYDPATDSWTATSASPLSGRYFHPAVWTGTMMLTWGGFGSAPMYKNDGAKYYP